MLRLDYREVAFTFWNLLEWTNINKWEKIGFLVIPEIRTSLCLESLSKRFESLFAPNGGSYDLKGQHTSEENESQSSATGRLVQLFSEVTHCHGHIVALSGQHPAITNQLGDVDQSSIAIETVLIGVVGLC